MTEHHCVALRETEITFGGPYRREIKCRCGWTLERPMERVHAVQAYAEHYALETQAAKPRARRGGVDDSEPTSKSHQRVLAVLDGARRLSAGAAWMMAKDVHELQDYDGGKVYSPQRVRTCLAGLVRAGVVEERKTGKHREYRMAVPR